MSNKNWPGLIFSFWRNTHGYIINRNASQFVQSSIFYIKSVVSAKNILVLSEISCVRNCASVSFWIWKYLSNLTPNLRKLVNFHLPLLRVHFDIIEFTRFFRCEIMNKIPSVDIHRFIQLRSIDMFNLFGVLPIVRSYCAVVRAFKHRLVRDIKVHRGLIQISASELRASDR